MSTTLLIADDHPLVLRSLAELVADWDFTVVATVANGTDARTKLETLNPDVALVDLHMPGLSGIELVRGLAAHCQTPVIIYTGYDDQGCLNDALDAGARGIILKEAPLDDLQRALRTVVAGAIYIDPVLSWSFVQRQAHVALTERERGVLRLLADGWSNDEVGKRLFISGETVRKHVAKATKKLGAHTRTQAVATALRDGIIL